jgi:hypothetical protein
MNATGALRTVAKYVGLAVILLGTSVRAAPPPPEPGGVNRDAVLTGPVASAISYQGRLTDSEGLPFDGTYDMVFQIWDHPSAGTQIGEIAKPGVRVNEGLFTVRLDLQSGWLYLIDGRGLWLRIQIDSQWLTPRQELLPAPYALTLRPGAIISSEGPDALHVWNTAGGFAIEAWSQNNIGLLGTNGGPGETPPSGMHGVHGVGDGVGVYGEGGHTGVHGSGDVDGVKGESTANNGVRGLSTSGDGVAGESASGHGIRGWTGTNTQSEISGVFGHSTQGTGVTGRSVNYNGVKAITQSSEHAALAAGNEGGGPGIYVAGGTDGVAAIFSGNVQIRSQDTGATVVELGEGLDYAEGFDVSVDDEIALGTVLIIDPDDVGKLAVAHEPYDRKVAGVVTGANGLAPGVRLGSDGFDHDVALAGRVYCNVDTSYGAIRPGDLLTTSPTPGYAMKVLDDARAQGAILGKAMEPMDEDQKGPIMILVTLQ